MSDDKEKMGQIVQRIDELLSVLKDVSEDLKTVSASLKSMAVSQITAKPAAPASRPAPSSSAPKPAAPAPAPAATAPKSQSVGDVHDMFPPELDNMLLFEDKGDYVMIKPKGFLGSENFAKIASTVRGIGGEYISAGRDSHFRVYKKKA